MPAQLEHIDAIARKLGRDVLYIDFTDPESSPRGDYRNHENRKHILQWLDREGIAWRECAPFASENVMRAYAGGIFIDVPYDLDDARYRKVQEFLEHPDGTMRFSDVGFYIMGLEVALKNAHHDEPGFWERWAEDF